MKKIKDKMYREIEKLGLPEKPKRPMNAMFLFS